MSSGPSSPTGNELSVEAALAPHAALVRRIRSTYGYPDDDFRQHLLTPVTALAAWLHLLPGRTGNGFERRGGAIEQALTTCLFSLQAADGRTFEACRVESTSQLDVQRWRLACALGGLFFSLREVLARIEVVSGDGHVWPAFAMPLLAWLESLPDTRYHYRWVAASADRDLQTLYAASQCIPTQTMALLTGDGARAAAGLLDCIAGSDRSPGQLTELVGKIAANIAAHERPCGTTPPAEMLADTLARLLKTPDWLPNSPGGHVWYGADGLYLLWPETAAKLLQALPQKAGRGSVLPSDDDLLRQLAADGVVQATPSTLSRIRLPGHDRPRPAVRVTEGHRIVEEISRRATPIDLRAHERIGDAAEAHDHATRHECVRADESSPAEVTAQQALDFSAGSGSAPPSSEPSEPGPSLAVDTSNITNPRIREVVGGVITRLDRSFDHMLSSIVDGGVFVALAEFVGQHGDGAAVVRSLHDAALLAVDDATASRRVVRKKIEGVEVIGVVLSASALQGYVEWKRRWQRVVPGEHHGE